MFHRKSLVLLHLMNKYTTSTIEQFFKRKYIVESKIFDISELFSVIQRAAVITWQVMLIYIHMGMSVYWSLSVLVILVRMCVKHISRSFWYYGTKTRHRSIISLSEITHQMWHDAPFSPRNKTSKIEVEVKVGGNRKEGLDNIWWGRQ